MGLDVTDPSGPHGGMMSVIAEFWAAPGTFPFGTSLRAHPNARIELERIIPTDRGPTPFFWVFGEDRAGIVSAIRSSDHVRTLRVIASLTTGDLCRLEWEDVEETLIAPIDRADAALLSMTGSSEGWIMELRAADRTRLEPFIADCEANGIDVELRRIHTVTDAPESYGLTDPQVEALEIAFEAGYFDDPRRISLEEVGERLGISRQAAGGRIRRGIRNLIGSTIHRAGSETGED